MARGEIFFCLQCIENVRKPQNEFVNSFDVHHLTPSHKSICKHPQAMQLTLVFPPPTCLLHLQM
jgi:hypothetical protein